MNKQIHVRFDWAVKRLLRDKANFGILEGFLSELLKEDITIKNVLESESNADSYVAKFNRVDLLVENQKGELVIIEIQNSYEADYFLRILFSVSKTIVEHIKLGENYLKIKKVISVNIIYFDLGKGEDYVYKGTTSFIGRHEGDTLLLTDKQKEFFNKEKVSDIYPEIYLIKVNNFNDLSKDTLDEWIYFFKNSEIKKEFKAKGLQQAGKELQIINLSEEKRRNYDKYIEHLMTESSIMEGNQFIARKEGIEEGMKKGVKKGVKEGVKKGVKEGVKKGMKEGLKEGIKDEKLATAKRMKDSKFAIKDIIKYTGLSEQEILNL